MSTVNSTLPTDPNRSCIAGFNEQTHFDPFLPSSPSDEEFLQLASDISSGLGSSQTPSPSPFTHLTDLDLQYSPPPQPIIPNHFYPFSPSQLPTNGFHESTAPSGVYDLSGIASSKNDFLNPSIYPADNGYTGLNDHSGTPNCEGELFLDVALLAGPGQELASSFLPNQPDQFLLEPTSANTLKSDYTHRASNGTTSHSSHLMSPVLTDRPSPDSRAGGASPPLFDHRAGNRGYMAEASLSGEEENMDNMHVSGPMQHTPAMTGSSMANSPDHSFVPLIARAASPVVRVESYRRGDSPARVDSLPPRSGSKRRGSAASFLSVRRDGDSSEDGEDDTLKFGSQHLEMPRHTRLSAGGDLATTSEGRVGLDPEARAHISDVQIPNFKDQEEDNQRSLKIADVHDWLAKSETGSAVGSKESPSLAPLKPKGTSRRQRAKSTGDSYLSHANLMRLRADPSLNAGHHIPGPGLLIDEDSVDEESESEANTEEPDEGSSLPESPPAEIEVGDPLYKGAQDSRPGEPMESDPPPPPLFRAKVWQDPLYDSTDPGVWIQPVTSNEAIKRYNQCAESIETLSRVATWGTRRLSESDLEGLFHRFTFSEKDRTKSKGDRRGSFLDAAAKLLPKRRGSLLKRKESEASKTQATRPADVEQPKRDSVGSRKESLGVPGSLQRKASLTKIQRSPKINTGSAVAAMGNQFATLGASGPISATGTSSPTNPWASARNVIKRSRSRSDLRGGHLSPVNLTGLWTRQGGPPMPALASPPHAKEERALTKEMGDDDDDDEDDVAEGKGVTIDFSIRAGPIIPTLEGFKSNVRELTRLPAYMVDRIAQEQLRRYKKLVDFKVKHVQATSKERCSSGKHCLELGGKPTYLPSKSINKESEPSHTGFSVKAPSPSDEDANTLAEGVVTPAQFPVGVPMPPVNRLPAEFECSLCFKVKKIHKPSDWSKHVHEDVQPFTCTFADCAEPKSFKRKADWVRHENERHRQLERWQCNINECTHKCFRKDNFVQHLVREHKLPEPRIKTAKTSKPAVRGPSSQKTRKPQGDHPNQADEPSGEIDQVWKLVEECRHETPKNPKDEPCKFCGNVCKTWKKLTVHLAKHMEQISMPVLNVVKELNVTPDTVVSPIEQRFPPQTSKSPPLQRSNPAAPRDVSPYGIAVEGVHDLSMEQFRAPAGGPFPRHHPSTYPPPAPSPNQPPKYPYPHGTSYNAGYYSNESSPSPQFNPINNSHGGYPPLQSVRSNNLYGAIAGPLTSEPRSTPLTKEDVYQTVYPIKQHQLQHQPAFSHMPGEAPMYVYSGPVTSYPQQPSMNAPVHLQYNPMQGMTYSQAPSELTQFSAKSLSTHPLPQQQQPEGYPYN